MIEQLPDSVTFGLLAGLAHGLIFGIKAWADGEIFEPIRVAITGALGLLVGLVIVGLGMDPQTFTTDQWFWILAAYVGVVAEIEALLKALARGDMETARIRLHAALQEFGDSSQEVMESGGTEAAEREITERSEAAGVEIEDPDQAFEDATREHDLGGDPLEPDDDLDSGEIQETDSPQTHGIEGEHP